jgi:beta-alanine degradation protein BauB
MEEIAVLRDGKYIRSLFAVFALGASSALAQDPAKVGPNIYKCTFDNERVRLCEVTFKPGAKIAVHSHPDHVAYVIRGGTLAVTGEDGKAQEFALKPGQALWLPAQSHSAVNKGKGEVKLVVVELKESPKK